MTAKERFAANLVYERKRAGLSQDDLAFYSGIHHSHISRFERSTILASFESLSKLAGSLEISPAVLMAGITWKPNGKVKGGLLEVEPFDKQASDPGQ